MNVEENKNDTDKRRKIITSKNDTELNVFTGMFDFSDDKQAAGVLGLQHQNEKLFRKSFLGKLSPITGGFLTENYLSQIINNKLQIMILASTLLLPIFNLFLCRRYSFCK